MKLIRNSVAIISFLLAVFTCAVSQKIPGSTDARGSHVVTGPTAKNVNHPKYLLEPVDIDTLNVGSNFVGNDIATIFNKIKNIPVIDKSEFEKESAAFRSQPIMGTITTGCYLAFVLRPYDWGVPGTAFHSSLVPKRGILGGIREVSRYHAKTNTIKVTLTAEPGRVDSGEAEMYTLPVRSVSRHRDEYGYDAYGTWKLFRSAHRIDYGVSFVPPTWLFPRKGNEATILLTIPPEKARSFKQHPMLVLICKLDGPWGNHSRMSEHESADPVDIPYAYNFTTDVNVLRVLPEQLWVVDRGTGEVLKKFSETSSAVERSK